MANIPKQLSEVKIQVLRLLKARMEEFELDSLYEYSVQGMLKENYFYNKALNIIKDSISNNELPPLTQEEECVALETVLKELHDTGYITTYKINYADINIPKGLNISEGLVEARRITLRYISDTEDMLGVNIGTPEFEACVGSWEDLLAINRLKLQELLQQTNGKYNPVELLKEHAFIMLCYIGETLFDCGDTDIEHLKGYFPQTYDKDKELIQRLKWVKANMLMRMGLSSTPLRIVYNNNLNLYEIQNYEEVIKTLSKLITFLVMTVTEYVDMSLARKVLEE